MDQSEFLPLRDAVRRFVRERLQPLERQVADEDAIPPETIEEIRQMGLFGLSIPTEYGGLGLSVLHEAQIMMEIGWVSPAFRSLVGTNNGIGSQGMLLAGTEEQKRRYLPQMASGALVGSFALTEPEAGSDAGSVRTSARRDGDSYVLNGTKRYITNAPMAGLFTVFARTDPEIAGGRGVSAFLVEADTPGINLGSLDRKMGHRGAHSCDVIFEDCRIPVSSRLGEEGQGFKTAMRVLDRGRIGIASVCCGAAERLIHESLSYATERKQFGKPIADFQLIQAMLADSRAEAYAARCMVEETARRKDAGEDVTEEAACCKMFASEAVGRIADRAVQIHGGAGYMAEYDVERFYRDVRLFRIYEGTTQIQQLVISRQMLTKHDG